MSSTLSESEQQERLKARLFELHLAMAWVDDPAGCAAVFRVGASVLGATGGGSDCVRLFTALADALCAFAEIPEDGEN